MTPSGSFASLTFMHLQSSRSADPASGLAIAIAVFFFLLVLIAAPVFSGCSGSKISASVAVSVDPSTCAERSDVNVTPRNDIAILDCAKVGGEGTITVEFPREQWNAMRAAAAGRKLSDAGATRKEPLGK